MPRDGDQPTPLDPILLAVTAFIREQVTTLRTEQATAWAAADEARASELDDLAGRLELSVKDLADSLAVFDARGLMDQDEVSLVLEAALRPIKSSLEEVAAREPLDRDTVLAWFDAEHRSLSRAREDSVSAIEKAALEHRLACLESVRLLEANTRSALDALIARTAEIRDGADGAEGKAGPEGPQGAPGAAGERGLQGERGEAGPQGQAGPQGAEGAPGAKGDPGPEGKAGMDGAEGIKGDPGERGADGAAGIQGDVGPAGPKGEQGERGLTGERGDVGLPGEKGEKGDDGAAGPIGERGVQGEQGPRGDPGIDGGRGEKGDKGDDGLPGVDGAAGLPGERGEKGEKGDQGDRGPDGLAGERGAQGERGLNGEDGRDGSIDAVKPWESSLGYVAGVSVFHRTGMWRALRPTDREPGDDDESWECLHPVLAWDGAWDGGKAYRALAAVGHNGASWVRNHAIDDGLPPGESVCWNLMSRQGKTGKPGPQGEPGLRGEAGPRGVDGTGIIDLTTEGGSLVAALSDGTARVIPLPQVKELTDLSARVMRGMRALGMQEDPEDDPLGTVLRRFRGMWDLNETYRLGDLVRSGTSLWLARETTSSPPGDPDAWILVLRPATGGGGGSGGDDYVAISGDTMTGALFLAGMPIEPEEAASKGYVDSAIASGGTFVDAPSDDETYGRRNASWRRTIDATGDEMSGDLSLVAGPPTLPAHATRKDYVDAKRGALWVGPAPLASEILFSMDAVQPFTLRANLGGWRALAGFAATGSTVFTVKKNGTTIGTMTWSVAGTLATLATTGGLAQSFALNDALEIVGPATPDATLSNVRIATLWDVT